MKKTYVLRTCNRDLKSNKSFQWPKRGLVECPDWDPKPECGNGLHGLLRGEGDALLLGPIDSKWLVVEVDEDKCVNLKGKVKFPSGKVVFVGTRDKAVEKIQKLCPGSACAFGTATAGDRGTATAGHSGTAKAGDRGTATAGDCGTAKAGDHGTATAGDCGKATAGDRGTATAGDSGTATAGDCGKATAGDRGTATAGHSGTATAGYSGTAKAGDRGTATAGYCGTAKAGDRGTAMAGDSGKATAGDYGTAMAGDRGTAMAGYKGSVIISFLEGGRRRVVTGYMGEDGIKANVTYKISNGKLVQA